jgi:hypothetical protein
MNRWTQIAMAATILASIGMAPFHNTHGTLNFLKKFHPRMYPWWQKLHLLHCPPFTMLHLTSRVVFKILKLKKKVLGCCGSVPWLLGEGQQLPWLL